MKYYEFVIRVERKLRTVMYQGFGGETLLLLRERKY